MFRRQWKTSFLEKDLLVVSVSKIIVILSFNYKFLALLLFL